MQQRQLLSIPGQDQALVLEAAAGDMALGELCAGGRARYSDAWVRHKTTAEMCIKFVKEGSVDIKGLSDGFDIADEDRRTAVLIRALEGCASEHKALNDRLNGLVEFANAKVGRARADESSDLVNRWTFKNGGEHVFVFGPGPFECSNALDALMNAGAASSRFEREAAAPTRNCLCPEEVVAVSYLYAAASLVASPTERNLLVSNVLGHTDFGIRITKHAETYTPKPVPSEEERKAEAERARQAAADKKRADAEAEKARKQAERERTAQEKKEEREKKEQEKADKKEAEKEEKDALKDCEDRVKRANELAAKAIAKLIEAIKAYAASVHGVFGEAQDGFQRVLDVARLYDAGGIDDGLVYGARKKLVGHSVALADLVRDSVVSAVPEQLDSLPPDPKYETATDAAMGAAAAAATIAEAAQSLETRRSSSVAELKAALKAMAAQYKNVITSVEQKELDDLRRRLAADDVYIRSLGGLVGTLLSSRAVVSVDDYKNMSPEEFEAFHDKAIEQLGGEEKGDLSQLEWVNRFGGTLDDLARSAMAVMAAVFVRLEKDARADERQPRDGDDRKSDEKKKDDAAGASQPPTHPLEAVDPVYWTKADERLNKRERWGGAGKDPPGDDAKTGSEHGDAGSANELMEDNARPEFFHCPTPLARECNRWIDGKNMDTALRAMGVLLDAWDKFALAFDRCRHTPVCYARGLYDWGSDVRADVVMPPSSVTRALYWHNNDEWFKLDARGHNAFYPVTALYPPAGVSAGTIVTVLVASAKALVQACKFDVTAIPLLGAIASTQALSDSYTLRRKYDLYIKSRAYGLEERHDQPIPRRPLQIEWKELIDKGEAYLDKGGVAKLLVDRTSRDKLAKAVDRWLRPLLGLHNAGRLSGSAKDINSEARKAIENLREAHQKIEQDAEKTRAALLESTHSFITERLAGTVAMLSTSDDAARVAYLHGVASQMQRLAFWAPGVTDELAKRMKVTTNAVQVASLVDGGLVLRIRDTIRLASKSLSDHNVNVNDLMPGKTMSASDFTLALVRVAETLLQHVSGGAQNPRGHLDRQAVRPESGWLGRLARFASVVLSTYGSTDIGLVFQSDLFRSVGGTMTLVFRPPERRRPLAPAGGGGGGVADEAAGDPPPRDANAMDIDDEPGAVARANAIDEETKAYEALQAARRSITGEVPDPRGVGGVVWPAVPAVSDPERVWIAFISMMSFRLSGATQRVLEYVASLGRLVLAGGPITGYKMPTDKAKFKHRIDHDRILYNALWSERPLTLLGQLVGVQMRIDTQSVTRVSMRTDSKYAISKRSIGAGTLYEDQAARVVDHSILTRMEQQYSRALLEWYLTVDPWYFAPHNAPQQRPPAARPPVPPVGRDPPPPPAPVPQVVRLDPPPQAVQVEADAEDIPVGDRRVQERPRAELRRVAVVRL